MTATSAQTKVARRKKKRISKHVIKANEERETTRQQNKGAIIDEPSNAKKPKRRKQKIHVKDPKEAASYLSLWKHREAGGAWKFNKNTQSWILRHCFEPDKVSKQTFSILLEYLKGLQGTTRTRTIADAQRRALRYKEFEKTNPEQQQQDSADKKEEDMTSSDQAAEENENDETRWKRLDAHDKRKEYKRARKVLDVLKE